MKRSMFALSLASCLVTVCLPAQENPTGSDTTLRINSRAVLVDVIVTDKSGNPVTGLKKGAFTITERGKPQSINFFEEHRGLTSEQMEKVQLPKLPPDVFSNYSPIAAPPAVNILLLDALNTPMADQMYLRQSAKNFLKSLRPGSRLAILTLSMRLHFVEGFSDDPALLAQALGYSKGDRAEPTVLVQSQEETAAQNTVIGLMNAQVGAGPGATTSAAAAGMIQSFQQFLAETSYSQTADREYRTVQALQQLASYLAAFPGRKNLIWLSGAFPLDIFGLTDMRFTDTTQKTVNLLAAARVALYPVDVRGGWTHRLYTAENVLDPTVRTPQQMMGPPEAFAPAGADPSTLNAGQSSVTETSGAFAHAVTAESVASNSSNAAMDRVAEDTGGKAFYNGNDLTGIIQKVVSSSSDFYTLAYTPADTHMNGAFRRIDVEVPGDYRLSYRRGYYARDEDLPGAAQGAQTRAIQQAANSPGADPLQPFMDFGLPQTGQILYKERIVPAPASPDDAEKDGKAHYKIDIAVDLKDLDLKLDSDGMHKGSLNLSLIVYDKYGQVASRRDHRVELDIKPNVWTVFEQTGLQLHADVEAPKGQYWLRTGIYDQGTQKTGTLEVPLNLVHPQQASVQTPQ